MTALPPSAGYDAPLRDWAFALFEVLDYEAHLQRHGAEVTGAQALAIAARFAQFAQLELAPLNRVGDGGCRFDGGRVQTPEGFKSAYRAYTEAGWGRLGHSADLGGFPAPESLVLALGEFMGAANWAFAMYPGLSQAAVRTLMRHGSAEIRERYLPDLVSGVLTGTMCLTEPQSGTDLGGVSCRARPQADGSYTITGQKLFISAGCHDLTGNILHIVLARIEGAEPGTRGVSLFAVPARTAAGGANGVVCSGIETKLGIRGNPSCALHFEGARGHLMGQAGRGIQCMFTFMNRARLGTALQGLCHAERALQGSAAYCASRRQIRLADGSLAPLTTAPDVRRMLLTQRALTEGMRLLALHCALLLDAQSESSSPPDELSLLTPIAKAFMSECGFESANLAVQCLGGYGYTDSLELAQNLRDCRVATLYEGTTGVQALDLLGRKILRPGAGRALTSLLSQLRRRGAAAPGADRRRVQRRLRQWRLCTWRLAWVGRRRPEAVATGAVDYLMGCGYSILGALWLQAMSAAREQLPAAAGADVQFYRDKLATGRWYLERLLPRADLHFELALKGAAPALEADARRV